MDTRKFFIGTIVGGIVLFGMGYVIFDLLLGDILAAQMTEAAAQVMREAPVLWSIGVGCLAWAALICHTLGNRRGAGAGAVTGAIVGFLLWVTADFFFFAFQDLTKLTQAIIDPLASAVLSAIAGAVIGLVLGKAKPA